MQATIIKDDNMVVVDGVAYTVDCSDLPENFHALQWYGDHGEVEHAVVRCPACGCRSKKPNDAVTDVAPYQKYLDAWHAAVEKAKADAAGPKD